MKRLLVLLFCFLFPLSGPAWALVDCFGHVHGRFAALHHHDTADRGFEGSREAEHDDPSPRFHCPELQFDIDSAVFSGGNLKPRAQYKDQLSSNIDLSTQHASLIVRRLSIESVRPFLPYAFLVGLSPHLLLSVFRI